MAMAEPVAAAKTMSDPAVTVIVIFDRGSLEPCLSSLLAQEGVEFEVVGLIPEGLPLPPALDHRVSLIPVADRNPARRRNIAAARARGKILAFIDDDAVAPPGWLKRAVAFIEADPECAGVGGPNLPPPDAPFLEQVSDLVLAAPLIGAGSRAYRGGGRLAEARPGELHLVNLAVRREWFEKVGGLNPALGYGGEDTEFVHLAVSRGGRFFFDPELVVHHRRRPFGPAYFRQRLKLRRQSARLFAARPGVYARRPGFWAALLALPSALAAAAVLMLMKWMSPLGWAALIYAALCIGLSSRSRLSRPALLWAAPVAFFLHHLVNLAGLWLGLFEVLLRGPWQSRSEIRSGRG